MRQRTRSALIVLLTAACLSGCDLTELGPLMDPPAGAGDRAALEDEEAPGALEEPAAIPGALRGLYYRNYSYYGGYPTPSFHLVENYYYFTADGRFYDGVPPGGLERFDWDKARRETPKKVGTYSIDGNTIVFSTADGKSRDMEFERADGADIRLDGYFTSQRGPFRQARLAAAYYNGAFVPGAKDQDALTSGRSLRLNADGTFEASNLATWGAAVIDQGEARGSYTLKGNTLALAHDGGNTTYHTVFPFGEDGDPVDAPGIINVDGFSFTIEGR